MVTKISSEQYGVGGFLCDSASDVSNLPTKTGVGSVALCVDDGKIYILNGSREWVEFGAGGDSNA